jgi:hydrogenase expression/formation protein HypC
VCLGMPGQVLELLSPEQHRAAVMVSGARRTVDVSLVEEDLAPGEWVLLHAGPALIKIAQREAQETLALVQEMSNAYLLGVAPAAEGRAG